MIFQRKTSEKMADRKKATARKLNLIEDYIRSNIKKVKNEIVK